MARKPRDKFWAQVASGRRNNTVCSHIQDQSQYGDHRTFTHSIEPDTILLWLHVHNKIYRLIRSQRPNHRRKTGTQNFRYFLQCCNSKAGVEDGGWLRKLLVWLEVVRVAAGQSCVPLQWAAKGHSAGVGGPAVQWCCRVGWPKWDWSAGFCMECGTFKADNGATSPILSIAFCAHCAQTHHIPCPQSSAISRVTFGAVYQSCCLSI